MLTEIAISFALAALCWRCMEAANLAARAARVRRWLRARCNVLLGRRSTSWIGASALLAGLSVCAVGFPGAVTGASFEPSSPVTSLVPTARATDAVVRPAQGRPYGTGGSPAAPPRAMTAALLTPSGAGVTAIGDSIMIDATPYLREMLPGIEIDASIGLQLVTVQSEVPQLRAEHVIGDRLILELGTNGPYSQSQLLDLLKSLGPMRRIVLVNVDVDRPWEVEVNATIAAVARRQSNITLVDWAKIGPQHLSYFYPDGVHLNPTGARYYAGLIVKALESGRTTTA